METTSERDSIEIEDVSTTQEEASTAADDNELSETPIGSTPDALVARAHFESLLAPQTQESWEQVQADLKELGPAAEYVILDELNSSDRTRREMAAQELVMLELDLADESDRLIAALDDESDYVRTYCAGVLLTQSPDAAEQAVTTLIDMLDSPDMNLSEMSASYLQAFPEAVVSQLPLVLAALEDAPPKVAVPLIESLAAAGPQASGATDALTQLAEADDPEIASAARQALDAIQGPAE